METTSNKNQRPLKAAIYMRFANISQISDDFEGLKIYREYVDEDYNVNKLNRPQFARVEADTKA